MSLEHLKMTKTVIQPATSIAFVNFVLIMVLLVMSTTIFAVPSGVELRFPTASQTDAAGNVALTIAITSENVIYMNNRVVTLNELRKALTKQDYRNSTFAIQADRRASIGRVSDILELCRGIPGVKVNVSTIF